MMPGEQPPERARMRLHAVRAADDEHGVVEHLQGALGFGGKIDMAGRVQQGDRSVRQGKDGLLGKDGDAALPFEREGIEKGVAVIDAAQLFYRAGLVQHRLGKRGFARVNMG